jgi:O-antigen ligase
MPLVAKLLGSDTVAAPSIFFLAFLFLFWFIPYLIRRGELSNLSIPLIFFIVCAILSTVAAIFIEIPTFKEFSVYRGNVQSLITLFIGGIFFIIVATYPKDKKDLKTALQVINWSGVILLVWAGVQAISWFGFHKYPQWMFDFQGMISSRVLYRGRVTGLALEPSWFSHELNMLYIPLWLAASIRKYSSHKFRIFGLSIENLLFVGSVSALALTLSRGGFIAFLSMLTLILFYLNIRLIDLIKRFWLRKRSNQKKISPLQSLSITVFLSIVIIICYLLLILAGTLVLSKVDPRMKDLFVFSQDKENPLLSYFNNLQFGERAVYWLAGWEIFEDHPLLGVGLGNAGFFFPQKILPYGWTLIEVRRLMYTSNILLNIKNLWLRLLAETGIVGFSFFISWIVLLFQRFLRQYNEKDKLFSMLALAGLFVIAALPAEGFSIDSFALPFLWCSLGLAVAGNRISQFEN